MFVARSDACQAYSKHLLRHLTRQLLLLILVGHIGQVVRLDQRVVTVASARFSARLTGGPTSILQGLADSGYTVAALGRMIAALAVSSVGSDAGKIEALPVVKPAPSG